jgi:hypothetical protein
MLTGRKVLDALANRGHPRVAIGCVIGSNTSQRTKQDRQLGSYWITYVRFGVTMLNRFGSEPTSTFAPSNEKAPLMLRGYFDVRQTEKHTSKQLHQCASPVDSS